MYGKKYKNCFGTTNINLCHQVEMDIAKGIAILLMVFANVSETLAWLFDPMESITVSKGICEYFLGGSFA